MIRHQDSNSSSSGSGTISAASLRCSTGGRRRVSTSASAFTCDGVVSCGDGDADTGSSLTHDALDTTLQSEGYIPSLPSLPSAIIPSRNPTPPPPPQSQPQQHPQPPPQLPLSAPSSPPPPQPQHPHPRKSIRLVTPSKKYQESQTYLAEEKRRKRERKIVLLRRRERREEREQREEEDERREEEERRERERWRCNRLMWGRKWGMRGGRGGKG